MPTTDRTVKSPIINILTKAQYDTITTPSEDEFYLITDDSSGDGFFAVTFTTGYDDTTGDFVTTCDKTYAEIDQALTNNTKIIGFIINSGEISANSVIVYKERNSIAFGFYDVLLNNIIIIYIGFDDTVHFEQMVTGKTTYTIYGDGTSTSFQVPNDYDDQDVIVQVYDTTDYSTVYCDVTRTSSSTITVSFAEPPASDKRYRVLMIA